MTPAEQADLDKLHAAQAKEYENFSSLCRSYLELSEEMLKHTGHKSIEAALLYAATNHRKKIWALAAAHVRKWPD
jgi:hypothetical protein